MDAGTHLLAIWRRRWFVLGGALAVMLAVFLVRAAASPSYTASASLFVVPGDTDGGDTQRELRRLGLTYADLADDDAVLSDVVAAVPGLTAAAVGSSTTVVPSDDGQLVVTGTRGSAVEAAALANALARALSAAADRESERVLEQGLRPLDAELAAVRSQLAAAPGDGRLSNRVTVLEQARLERVNVPPSRLDVVSPARASFAVRTPEPARDAAFAGVLALIVCAELAALVAARRGGIEGADPLGVVRSWTGLPVFRAGPSERGHDQGAAALLHVASTRPGGSPVVVALAAMASPAELRTAVRSLLASGTVLYGATTLIDLRADDDAGDLLLQGLADDVEVVRDPHVDLGAVSLGGAPVRSGRPLTLVVADAWDDPDLLIVSRATRAVTLLVLDAASARRHVVREAMQTLEGLQTGAVAALVVPNDRGRGAFSIWEYDETAQPVNVPQRVSLAVADGGDGAASGPSPARPGGAPGQRAAG